MMIAALVALALGAVAGIFLATRHFLHKRLPASVALFHGLGGATGFTLVLLTVVSEPTFRPIRDVLYFLIATVVLGVVNLLFHIRKVRHRTSLILLHGLTAVTSASLLIRAIWVHVPATEPVPAAAQPAVPTAAAVASAPTAVEPQAVADGGPPAADAATAQPSATDALPADKPTDEFVVDESVRQALNRSMNFETRSAQVSQDSLAIIAEIAAALKAHPEITLLEVQGHADERGDDFRNVALTRARAGAVVEALVANGIARERLRSAGYGARCPEDSACRQSDAPDSCHTPESWQRDRRVVFVALQVAKASYKGEVVCARGADLIPPEHRRFHTLDD
jgi:outer membrane protein OmpA-like peptidoglycan-associated protein